MSRLRTIARWVAARFTGPERAPACVYIPLDFPTSAENEHRYGWGKPDHARLTALISQYDGAFARTVEELSRYADELAAIPVDDEAGRLHWTNGYCSGLDAACIYGFVRSFRPRRFVEIGSGYSTLFAARAKEDGGLRTRIISIDPHPRIPIDRVSDRLIRDCLETTDLSIFGELEAGDVIFMDGSHRAFMNSDAVVFVLDVLPDLPAGVVVGIDDVLLPSDYFPEWSARYYSEQYLLAAYLLGGSAHVVPLLPCHYVSDRPELNTHLRPLWDRPHMRGVYSRGKSWWLRITDS